MAWIRNPLAEAYSLEEGRIGGMPICTSIPRTIEGFHKFATHVWVLRPGVFWRQFDIYVLPRWRVEVGALYPPPCPCGTKWSVRMPYVSSLDPGCSAAGLQCCRAAVVESLNCFKRPNPGTPKHPQDPSDHTQGHPLKWLQPRNHAFPSGICQFWARRRETGSRGPSFSLLTSTNLLSPLKKFRILLAWASAAEKKNRAFPSSIWPFSSKASE